MKSLQHILRVKARIEDYISRVDKSVIGLALIIFFSSTQLGFHWWPQTAFVYGVRVDYLSPTLYFLDVIVFISLIFNRHYKKTIFPVIHSLYLVLLLTNLLFSANPLTTLVWSLRFLVYFAYIFSLPSSILFRALRASLPFVIVFQVLLGAVQVALGRSLQGPLYWLGERVLSVGSPNIAKWSLFGETTLRSYGTFSHPNILAGWLVVCLLIMWYLSRSPKLFTTRNVMVTLGVSLGLFLTNSRAAMLSFFGVVIPFVYIKAVRTRLIYFLFVSLFFIVYSSYFILHTSPSPSRSSLSVSERLDLMAMSQKIVTHSPLFGSGANAAITLYPSLDPSLRLLQPDHNSFTLFLSWFGIVGVISFVYLLRFPIIHSSFFLFNIFPLLPLLLLDHYFLTSIQGMFILLLFVRVSDLLTIRSSDSPIR